MLSMKDKTEVIRLAYSLHLSDRKISKRTGFNRRTVRKILNDYGDHLVTQATHPEIIGEYLITPPTYNSSSRKKRVLTPEVIGLIDSCLKENKIKSHSGRHKQIMRKQDIHAHLLSRGFLLSYVTVCRYINSQQSLKSNECFIKQTYTPGYAVEFDWGVVKLNIKGKIRKFLMGVFTMSHSNARWGCLYQHEDTLAFMESHVEFFRYLGGIPHEVVYDNMRVAVARFSGDKQPTEALKRMMIFYGYKHRFCNVRRGNEKGHVERSVEVLRRKAFCLTDSFDSLEEANIHLRSTYINLNSVEHVHTRLKEEKVHLQPYLGEMGCFEMVSLKVDKQSTFCFKKSHYSVPDFLVNRFVEVKIYSEKLKVYYNKKLIHIHPRCYGQEWILVLNHYLNTFVQKPGALKGSLTFKQAPKEIQEMYQTFFTKDSKGFIALLLYAKQESIPYTQLIQATHKAVQSGVSRVTTDHVRQLLENQSTPQEAFKYKEKDLITQRSKIQLQQITQLMNQL